MNLMKLVCAIFTLYQIAFGYFFQVSEEGKTDDNNFNPLMPDGNKKVMHTSSWKLHNCLSMCDLFVISKH